MAGTTFSFKYDLEIVFPLEYKIGDTAKYYSKCDLMWRLGNLKLHNIHRNDPKLIFHFCVTRCSRTKMKELEISIFLHRRACRHLQNHSLTRIRYCLHENSLSPAWLLIYFLWLQIFILSDKLFL